MMANPGLHRSRFFFLLFALLSITLAACRQPGERAAVKEIESTVASDTQLDDLNRKISADSLNPELYYQRSLHYLSLQDINTALSDINRAIQLKDDRADFYVALSDIYLASGRIKNCIEALNRAETLDPRHNDALLKLAEVYLLLQDYQKAFHYTKTALDNDRMNPVAHFIRGYAYLELGDTSLAVKNFQLAADQDQQYYKAYVQLGILYSVLKDPLAVGYLQTATMIEPNRPEAYYLLGMAYQDQENIPKAIETYQKLLTISPGYKEAYYNQGYLQLVYVNDFEAAVELFTRAIELDPNYTDAYFNRGYSYELMGNLDGARHDYLKALEIYPNYEKPVLGLNRLDSILVQN